MKAPQTKGGAARKGGVANGRSGGGGRAPGPALPRQDAASGTAVVRAPRRLALARAAAALAGAMAVVLLALSVGEGPAPATSAARAPEQRARAPVLPPALIPDTVAAVAQPRSEPAILSADAGLAASSPRLAGAPAAGPLSAAAAPTTVARAPGVLIPPAAAAAVGAGYLVQLGVFADPANALKLYEQAAAVGQPARIQSRVVLGPFADRPAAERARKALQAAGARPGVVIAPERGR